MYMIKSKLLNKIISVWVSEHSGFFRMQVSISRQWRRRPGRWALFALFIFVDLLHYFDAMLQNVTFLSVGYCSFPGKPYLQVVQ